MNFPLFKTKTEDGTRFNLSDPADRRKYFDLKAGEEIKKLNEYLDSGKTFVGYLLGKKNSGKGTYSKLFAEALGTSKVGHVSVGDIVRDVHDAIESGEGKEELMAFLAKNYRGFHGFDELEDIILGRSTTTLISSELIMALIKYEIAKRPRTAIFMDGFPRALDQVRYSLYLKELIGYRDDPDFLVFISVPNTVIDERIRYRVVCPKCKTPRNVKLLATHKAGFDEAKGEFYLFCDNPECGSARMVRKEGDDLGIEPIRERLELDGKVMEELVKLHGVPKVFLRNCIPLDQASEYANDYEFTPEYYYERPSTSSGQATEEVKILERPWVVKDDEGVESYSLLPAAIVVSFLKQAVKALGL